MDDATHKAIADLSALTKDADSEDAERIHEIIERLKNYDAQLLMLTKRTAHLHLTIHQFSMLPIVEVRAGRPGGF